MLSLLRELAWTARPDAQQAVAGQLLRLRATIDEQEYDPTGRARLRGSARQVDQAMVGRWVSERD